MWVLSGSNICLCLQCLRVGILNFPRLDFVPGQLECVTEIVHMPSYPRVTMAMYEVSLGPETCTNNPLVNSIMATEADFFVGAGINVVLPHRWNEEHRRIGHVWMSAGVQR